MRIASTLVVLAAALAICGGRVAAEGRDSAPELGSPAAEFPSSVGAFASSWSGGGLSYQRWYGSFGYAVTAGGFASPAGDELTGSVSSYFNWNYNVEVDLLYRLFASNFWNWLSGDLFAYATLSHQGQNNATYDEVAKTWAPGSYEPTITAGIGIGYEIVVFRHFSIPLLFGYAVNWPFAIDFDFGGGLRYRY